MSVSIDTYDEESGIHPRNKQLVSKRLATAGLNVAYGKTEFPTNGPFPNSIQFSSAALVSVAEIVYNEKIVFDVKEFGGFYFCCQADYLTCDDTNSWKPVITLNFFLFKIPKIFLSCKNFLYHNCLKGASSSLITINSHRIFAFIKASGEIYHDSEANMLVVPIESCATGFAYLWNETPVLGTEALSIYADNEAHLPAAPWKTKVQLSGVVETIS